MRPSVLTRQGPHRGDTAMTEMLAVVGAFAVLKWTYDLFQMEGYW